MSATEHRIFPIVWLDNQLVVIEVCSYRHEKLELRNKKYVEVWSSKVYVRQMLQNGTVVKSHLLDSLKQVSLDDLLINLEQLVEQQKLNFEENVRISCFEKLEFLAYDSTRSANYLSTNQEEIFLKVGDKERYFPFDSIPEIGQVALSRICGFDFDSNQKLNLLRINSIRGFEIGGKRLMLFHIAYGDFNHCNSPSWNQDKSKRKRREMKEPNLNSTVFFESMPHHGIGFDFLVWE